MLIETVSGLLHDYSSLLLLLSVALLGFSAGLLRTPSIRGFERDAESRTGKPLGSRISPMQKNKGGKLGVNTNKDDPQVDAMQREVKQEKGELVIEKEGLRKRFAQDSSSRPGWLRSLSLGQRRRQGSMVKAQDSNTGPPSERPHGVVERKASLTGEEVKVLADDFIARMRQRMRVQRQESSKRHAHSQVSYQAPPLP